MKEVKKPTRNVIFVGSGVVSIPPQKGGATELIIFELSKHLAKQGNRVLVYDLKTRENKSRESVEGAVYERFGVPRFNNIFLMRLSEFAFGLKAFFRARKIQYDLIHCQTVFSALPFVLLRKFLGGRLIYTSHNPAWTVEKNDIFNGIILGLEGYVIKHSDTAITVSNEMKKGIVDKTGIDKDKIKVVYNFVDMAVFRPAGTAWKRKMGVNGPMVIFVGKLVKNKGVEHFIRAAGLVRENIPDVKFVLVGPVSFEYDARNQWKDLVQKMGLDKNVIFAGPATSQDLPKAYSSADVFCFPTLKEAFGIVIIESMACGTPVVTTDLPVIREVVGDAAMLVKSGDERSLAEAVERLLGSRQLRERMKKASLKRSRLFEKKRIMAEYEKIYSDSMK